MIIRNTTLLLLTLFAATPLLAGDPEAGREVSQNCAACHGETGISPNPEIPNLAGQLAEYITMRLDYFKQDAQQDNVMHSVAIMIDDPKMVADVAAYYASIPTAVYEVQDSDRADYGKDVYFGLSSCSICHGENAQGIVSNDGFPSPRLNGLSREYIKKSLNEFRSGARTSNQGYMMTAVVSRMFDNDIEALAEYLSTYPREPASETATTPSAEAVTAP